MNEEGFVARLRAMATHPAARGLTDDAAVLETGAARLVLTADMIVEGVHYLPEDPPGDVAWKLVAVNLSDLAAKGARPVAALLGFTLGDEAWDRAFADGLERALGAFALPLLGGDTVAAPGPRTLALTLIGEAPGRAPARADGRAGDQLWVSGAIGDAGAGLAIARGARSGPEALVERYRAPRPRLEAGLALAPLAGAMMDVSDGLLIDARRLAAASGLAATIDLDALPLSDALLAFVGDDRAARLSAATAGDDYELLFSARPERAADILALGERIGLPFSRIGALDAGAGLLVRDRGEAVELPARLGYRHG